MENGIDRADAFPGNVGNVEQAFYAAEVDECTIGHDLDDRAFEDSAFFNVFEGFFAFCFAFCFEDGFAGKDEAVLVFVDVDDFDLEGLAYEIVQRFNEFDIALGKGNETTQGFDGNDKASLVRFFTCTFDELVVFKSIADFFPVFDFFILTRETTIAPSSLMLLAISTVSSSPTLTKSLAFSEREQPFPFSAGLLLLSYRWKHRQHHHSQK